MGIIILYLIWAAVIMAAWPQTLLFSRWLMDRFPQLKGLWWGYRMLHLAFALAPMMTGWSEGEAGFPAGLGVVVGILNPSGLPSAYQEMVNDCVVSFLITWGVLWIVRCLVHFWRQGEQTGESRT